MTVLVVCQANTARSVMAEALLVRMLAERGLGDRVRVSSAGVAPWARDGMLASLDARLVLREIGIEVGETAHRSRSLNDHPQLLAEADLVVTMTTEQKHRVASLPGAAGRRIVTLRELAGEPGDIGDPAGQGEEVFRVLRDEIRGCLERAMPRLLAEERQ